ncbi:MAG: polysaccharide deacetylase family protein [Planctomycetes bacterium]|nr:polysaccharide deacetylase family protein [Planctomycetota bacterium]
MNIRNYPRRDFLKKAGAAAASVTLPVWLSSCSPNNKGKTITPKKKKHIVTLSFDDGFKKSSIKTAEIYEKYNLSACINVLATGHLDSFEAPTEYLKRGGKGDFGLWNELKQRGHEIMPHGYKHANKAKMPLDEAKGLIMRCLDYFADNLDGFKPKGAIFNFPFNASTPELESWLATKVLAFRTRGNVINALPHKGQVKLTCRGFGPASSEQFVEQRIEELLSKDSGWLICCVHGLDGEGWGPMRSNFLDKLLERLSAIESVKVMPAGKALAELSLEKSTNLNYKG